MHTAPGASLIIILLFETEAFQNVDRLTSWLGRKGVFMKLRDSRETIKQD
jgi:hypothetical protein